MKSETIVILALIGLIWYLLRGMGESPRPLPPKPTHEQTTPQAPPLYEVDLSKSQEKAS